MEFNTDTEKKILDAAKEVFLEKGRDGARMDDIARRAGLNKALLHYYFRSKEKLYQQVFTHEVEIFLGSIMGSVSPNENIRDFLKDFIFNYVSQIKQHPQVVNFVLWEISRGGELFKQVLSQVFASSTGPTVYTIIEKIEEAVRQGKIRPVDPHQLLFSLIGMSVFVFVARPVLESIFPEVRVGDDPFIELRKQEIFNLVWNGIKP